MSANRIDALKQLATGLRKFDGYTAAQVLAEDWTGLKGLHAKDIDYFALHGDKPVTVVALACMDRSAVRNIDPLA